MKGGHWFKAVYTNIGKIGIKVGGELGYIVYVTIHADDNIILQFTLIMHFTARENGIIYQNGREW